MSLLRSVLTRRRLIRVAAIGLMTVLFVALLPVAPAQQRDLGTVRTAAPTPGSRAAAAAAAAEIRGTLPYRPFIDPARGPVHRYWYLLLAPMAFGVAVVYKAVAMHALHRYWHQVLYMTVQIVVSMILLGVASYVLVMLYVPWMASH